jgi:hypothetical protein
MTKYLVTDYGIVPIEGEIASKDIPAIERCARVWAWERLQEGCEEIPTLSVADAKFMPSWQQKRQVRYSNRGIV